MEAVVALPRWRMRLRTNQVMYNLNRRGIEYSLIPWCEQHRVPIMAYSPLDQGKLLRSLVLSSGLPRSHSATPRAGGACLDLAAEEHDRDSQGGNAKPMCARITARSKLHLDAEDFAELDRAFPPPGRKKPLEST